MSFSVFSWLTWAQAIRLEYYTHVNEAQFSVWGTLGLNEQCLAFHLRSTFCHCLTCLLSSPFSCNYLYYLFLYLALLCLISGKASLSNHCGTELPHSPCSSSWDWSSVLMLFGPDKIKNRKNAAGCTGKHAHKGQQCIMLFSHWWGKSSAQCGSKNAPFLWQAEHLWPSVLLSVKTEAAWNLL